MFTSWYLSNNVLGVEKLFLFTLCVMAAYCVLSVLYAEGRTAPALKRSLIGFLVAEVMTEGGYWLGYMDYFNRLTPMTEPARMFPAVVVPVLFTVCCWLFVRILNNMLRK